MTVRFALFDRFFLKYAINANYTVDGFIGYDVFGDPIKTSGLGGNLLQENGGVITQENGGAILIQSGSGLNPFKMVVQPLTAEELDQMPKGSELSSTLKFYTTHIIPIDDATQNVMDIVIQNYKGKNYRVVSRKPWENSTHLKYLCVEDRLDAT